MPTYRDHAVVLNCISLRDNDRQYILFTNAHGKISLLAKGTRKGRSKLSPHLSLFGIVDVMIARGKKIDRLAGANAVRVFRHMSTSLEAMSLSQSFLLAVDALTKRELPDERIFLLIEHFFLAMNHANIPLMRAQIIFSCAMIKVLDLLGFGLEFEVCVHCRRPLDAGLLTMNILHGGVECGECAQRSLAPKISVNAVKAFRFFRKDALSLVVLLRLPESVLREVLFFTELMVTMHVDERFVALKYARAMTGGGHEHTSAVHF